ncbi:hypothetical protein [Halomonas daqiaonensis]|uniref:Two-component system, chemotaxis family, CheB/CheR fusion protein n=1 Tax=Halomonas daqiaonensis TaxID=650850 RepID=A0A1H7MTA7_9GAMM|nr:hypothetical protein [Halomonas daqiaonensis]SEL14606.1 two-component system, chemotaxis family, CheB/CheR fusion protein [Halomonas daqiaonensis]
MDGLDLEALCRDEELQTINAEMQTKLDDFALAQSDMNNLLNSIEIAILFLDLNLRRHTDRASKIISIRNSTTMLLIP